MKKVIIRTREDELTTDMYYFGTNCAKQFIEDLELETHGKDWNDCLYQSDDYKGLAKLNKNQTISVCVFSKEKD